MKKIPIASSRCGNTNVLSMNYTPKTIDPKSEYHEADLVDTLYFRRKHHSEEKNKIGYKY